MMFPSPARHQLHEIFPYFYPFGSYKPHNALEGFDSYSSPQLDDDNGIGSKVCTGYPIIYSTCLSLTFS